MLLTVARLVLGRYLIKNDCFFSCPVCRKWPLRSRIPIRIFHHVGHVTSSSRVVVIVFSTFSRWPTAPLSSSSVTSSPSGWKNFICLPRPKHRWWGKVLRSSWNCSGLLRWPSWLDWNDFSQDLAEFIFFTQVGQDTVCLLPSSSFS